MRNARKRYHDYEDDSSSSSSKINSDKKHRSYRHLLNDENHRMTGKQTNFIPYSEISSLPPKLKLLCEIIAKTPALVLESYLEDTGIIISQQDVVEVLKLSYDFPGAAVKFFRWASKFGTHSAYAWNLVVDLLGKNGLFDAMWDAIKSMRKELLVTLSTFASVFSSYVISNRVQEAILSFEVIDQYGIPKNTVALNCLLRLICKEGKIQQAREFLGIVKDKSKFDSETYMILLEGWEKEENVDGARQTFSEMIIEIGWEKQNVSAYDSFLCTLLKGPDGTREVLRFFYTMKDRSCFPGMKFLKLAIDECERKNDAKSAKLIWDSMVVKKVCQPDEGLYKSLISLYCNIQDFVSADKLLDEMVYNGVFPNSETYNTLFHSMIKHRYFREAAPVFKEMLKNEILPKEKDCFMAVKAYIYERDTQMATKVWRCMIENYSSDLEEIGNFLILGLQDGNRVPEAVKCAEDMIERGIKVNSATLSKLKQSLLKSGKEPVYEQLLSKWKNH